MKKNMNIAKRILLPVVMLLVLAGCDRTEDLGNPDRLFRPIFKDPVVSMTWVKAEWDKYKGTNSYEVELSTDTFKNILRSNRTDSARITFNNLEFDTPYQIRVRGVGDSILSSGDTIRSEYNVLHVRTQDYPTQLITPASADVIDKSIRVKWKVTSLVYSHIDVMLDKYTVYKTVPLTEAEKKALRLSGAWSRRSVEPVLTGGGKVVFVHGASLPTIVAAPMQVCDVELQAGETVHEIVVGDSSRWMVDSGTAGSGPGATAHLFIKPVDSGLESSAVVTTDRRVYHLRLVSQRSGHTPYVGFLYSESLKQQAAWKQSKDAKEREWNSTTVDGKPADLSALNFSYEVKGKARWKPERVYDDGRQTFIRLPENSASGEMPVLLVRKGKQDVLVNYRVKDSAMIVDGLFDRIALIIGVGGDQEKVEVIRGNK